MLSMQTRLTQVLILIFTLFFSLQAYSDQLAIKAGFILDVESGEIKANQIILIDGNQNGDSNSNSNADLFNNNNYVDGRTKTNNSGGSANGTYNKDRPQTHNDRKKTSSGGNHKQYRNSSGYDDRSYGGGSSNYDYYGGNFFWGGLIM